MSRHVMTPGGTKSSLINVIGNVATGKSTLSAALGSQLNIPYVSIDSFRKQFHDGKATGERQAQDALIYALSHQTLCILEHSGVGKFRYVYQRTFNNTITILCSQPDSIIRANIESRTEAHDPLVPNSWKTSASNLQNAHDTAKRIGEMLVEEPFTFTYDYNKDTVEELITKLTAIFVVPTPNME